MTEALKPLKWYKALTSRKGRLDAGAFLVEGERAISQVVRSQPEAILEIITVTEPPPEYRHYPLRLLNESQFAAIAPTRTPQGFMALVKAPDDIYSAELPPNPGGRILLLEDIQDPGNAGTLLRTAAAFNYNGIIMSEKCADPLSPKCVQGSAGTLLSLWIRRSPLYLDMTAALKTSGYTVIAADLDGNIIPAALREEGKLLLALGNEAAGLTAEALSMAHYRLHIPINTTRAESLNVAACGAICMYLTGFPKNTNKPG
jgi:RNA methyltransferase, TrmH family